MNQVYKILSLSFILLAVQGEIVLNTKAIDSIIAYEITSSEQLVVIGFEGQEETRDYLFCRMSDCSCEDMISRGPRSHPQYNDVQTTANIQCENSNTMTFERMDNGFKPYLWGNEQKETKRIAAEASATATATGTDSVTYSDTDMTATKTVDSSLVLKWKFNTDGTIEMCILLSKKAWVGIGLGSGMKGGVDMFAINIVNNVPVVKDLWSTAENQPPEDTKQDISIVSYSVTDSALKVRVKRLLDTGDSTQDTVLKQGSAYTWSYASSQGLTMENHGSDVKTFSITLSATGEQVQTNSSFMINFLISLIMITIL